MMAIRVILIPIFGLALAVACAWYLPEVVDDMWEANTRMISSTIKFFGGGKAQTLAAKVLGVEKMALVAEFDFMVGLVWWGLSATRIH